MGDSSCATAQDNLCLFSPYSSIHFIEKTKFTSLKKENMKIETDRSINYSSLSKGSKVSLSNTSMKRYDAQTMNDHYGNQWRSYASTVREVEQPDGTILKGEQMVHSKNNISILIFFLCRICFRKSSFSQKKSAIGGFNIIDDKFRR